MHSKSKNPVEWSGFVTELEDASEHLKNLLADVGALDTMDEEDLRVQLGHIYAHLNRAWHTRAHRGEVSSHQWMAFSAFPRDVPWT